jgi:predicted PurR-regulated permease PerM
VARATLKGSLLIGVVQGTATGIGLWVTGVPSAAFWGTVTIVVSMIPAIGSLLVWVPAVLYLMVIGHVGAALALLAWCGLGVSSIDNFLRPVLIGRDTKMSDLMVLLSTLGGIMLFGMSGFIVGPIVAALFVTIWHLYGEAFRDLLPGEPPAEA